MSEEQPADMLARLGSDAVLWAQEFNKTAVRLGYSEMDEGWLIGWFANAIENSCNPLRNRIEELHSNLEAAWREAEEQNECVCEMLYKISKMREALVFYAQHSIYTTNTVYMGGEHVETAIELDGGNRARAVLEEINGGSDE